MRNKATGSASLAGKPLPEGFLLLAVAISDFGIRKRADGYKAIMDDFGIATYSKDEAKSDAVRDHEAVGIDHGDLKRFQKALGDRKIAFRFFTPDNGRTQEIAAHFWFSRFAEEVLRTPDHPFQMGPFLELDDPHARHAAARELAGFFIVSSEDIEALFTRPSERGSDGSAFKFAREIMRELPAGRQITKDGLRDEIGKRGGAISKTGFEARLWPCMKDEYQNKIKGPGRPRK
jgi:hypothetical protein